MSHETTYSSRSARTSHDTKRKSSSDSHSSSSSSSSSLSSASSSSRGSMDRHYMPKVETLRCSRCAKSVETITDYRSAKVSTADATASGMVRFGHNLYYCERCAKMVGYT